ncbi:ATP-binding protein [Streptomyces sp. G-G2]|uniref:ATP-binding protein n=1 Tax=Streptomyces sp. G-G2 TaxID=3046201 RepID=UPI0024B94497|nr:ATP-binding protein [Streptomyces sp. G-G2]MDJ0386202.1 ATP-binding protein [Streptomyces sp. G-G2]
MTSHFLHDAMDDGEAVVSAAEDAAALIVTELVANAVRHTDGPCTLDLAVHGGLLDIDVTDTSPNPPEVRPPHVIGSGGWGWLLVRHVARDVTVLPTRGGGKCVHASIALAE